MTKRILKTVDEEKGKTYQSKLDALRDDDWGRENFQEKLKAVEETIDNVDDLMTQIQSQINKKQSKIGEKKGTELHRKLKRKFDGKYELTEIYDLRTDIDELRQQWSEWKAYQQEVLDISNRKLQLIAVSMRKELLGGKVAKHLHESASREIDDKVERVEQRLEQQVSDRHDKVERTLDQVLSRLERDEEAFVELATRLVDILDNLPLETSDIEALADQVDEEDTEVPRDERGHVDFDADEDQESTDDHDDAKPQGPGQPDVFELAELEDERAEDNDSDRGLEYELEGKSLEAQYQVLKRLAQKHDVREMTQREITRMTDLESKTAIFGDGKMLDKIEERFGKNPLLLEESD